MAFEKRAELRVSEEEHESYLWALAQDGAGSVSAWLRQLANQRVRQLRREATPARRKSRGGGK